LAVPYKEHPCFPQPEDETIPVWRFLNLPKYLDLMNGSTLHFARLDQFEDPYEGRPFGLHREALLSKGDAHMKSRYAAVQQHNRYRMYVNSWHLARYEPASMWKQYASQEPSVAVCSTYSGLKAALDKYEDRVYLGLVNYEAVPLGGSLDPFAFVMSKRPNFDHEREVRAVVWRPELSHDDHIETWSGMTPEHVKLSVDLASLVHEVRLSPAAPAWLPEVLSGITAKLGLPNVPVSCSSLYVEPPGGEEDNTLWPLDR
jgi:hypothetical protein